MRVYGVLDVLLIKQVLEISATRAAALRWMWHYRILVVIISFVAKVAIASANHEIIWCVGLAAHLRSDTVTLCRYVRRYVSSPLCRQLRRGAEKV
jgi:hypothetical protein